MADRIAFLHPAPWIPDSGGERNMAAIMQAMQGQGLTVQGVCRPGPLAAHFQSQGLAAQAYSLWRPQAAQRATYLRLAAQLYGAMLTHPALPAATLAALLDALEAVCEPDALRMSMPHHHSPLDTDSELLLPGEPDPTGGALQLMLPLEALRLRAALRAVQPQVVFADYPWHVLAATVALQGTDMQLVWYPQLSEPDKLVDPILATYRPHIVTCGAGVKATRFANAADVLSIANGVDTRLFAPRLAGAPRPALFQDATSQDRLLVTVGNVIPRKGGRQLIAAARFLALTGLPFHLYFIGSSDPAFRRTLQRDVMEAGLREQVHFVGSLDTLPQVLPHADVFVLPSLAEGLPLSLCEAMACGVPCVASDLAGCREVAGGRAALLVLPDDPVSLARTLLRVLRSDTLQRQLAERGRAQVVAHFGRHQMMQKFGDYLRGL